MLLDMIHVLRARERVLDSEARNVDVLVKGAVPYLSSTKGLECRASLR